jgi:WD40 repeat protein
MGRRRSSGGFPVGSSIVGLFGTALVLACAGPTPTVSPAPSAAPSLVAEASASAASSTVQPRSPRPAQPIGSTGRVALLSQDGSLSMVEAGGQMVAVSKPADGTFGFPTWSPDGSRIAAARSRGSDKSIVVFDADALAAGGSVEPVAIFESTTIDPFYLFWTPDGKAVSFLGSEAGELSLRIATVDGTAPEASGPGALVRKGNPFYYDWIGRDRLLAHIGVGKDSFLGEIGLDGKSAGKGVGSPGDFRSAVVSHDRTSIAFVRHDGTGTDAIVVAARDGSREQTMEVFGTAAVNFDPAGDTLAGIGPTESKPPAGFPLGPLRLMDVKSGIVRTLIDGRVVSFWWSPDGRTIAALRLQPASGSGLPSPAPTADETQSEIHLLFVDVATTKTRSDPVVQVSLNFVNGVLAYFDQYALSHRVWAPDSSSILLPETGSDGSTHVMIRFPDGEPPIALDGELGFWSP